MRLSAYAAAVCAIASSVLALPLVNTETYSTFRSLSHLPEGYALDPTHVPKPCTRLRLRIYLRQPKIDEFRQRALDIATPGHKLYRQHMSQHALREMLKPADDAVNAVLDWLTEFGLRDQAIVQEDWVYIDTKLSEVENLLQTKYEYFVKKDTKERVLRTTKYSLPRALHNHIDLITPTTYFGHTGAMKSSIVRMEKSSHFNLNDKAVDDEYLGTGQNGLNVAKCSRSITPDCLTSLYSISGVTPAASTHGTFGIAGYLEQYVQNNDLGEYLRTYVPNVADMNPDPGYDFVSINGGLNTQDSESDFSEANLDAQYGIGMTYPMKAVYYQTGGRPENGTEFTQNPDNVPMFGGEIDNEPYRQWLDYMLALPDPLPHTITTSYGENEQSVPFDYANKVCDRLGALGCRGVSIMFSSGDGGPGHSCVDYESGKTQFQATFPASCPYVTGVGGTIHVEPEEAVDFSGGGFSKYWAIPSYQRDAKTAWQSAQGLWQQQTRINFDGLYNQSGRGVPDVSAQSSNFHVYVGGYDQLINGTSAASPAFAAIIALVNGQLVSEGRKPLGFLNPFLYGEGKAALTDIVKGKSVGCNFYESFDRQVKNAGWSALKGWDPVTGLGTPNMSKLLQLARTAVGEAQTTDREEDCKALTADAAF